MPGGSTIQDLFTTMSEADMSTPHSLPAGDIFERSFATSALHGGGVAELRQYLFDRCCPGPLDLQPHSTGILCARNPRSHEEAVRTRACHPPAASSSSACHDACMLARIRRACQQQEW